MAELQSLLLSLKYDILAVTETWLTSDIPDQMISQGLYKVTRRDRYDGSGYGGVLLLTKHRICIKTISLDKKYDSLELVAVDIFAPNPHRLICAYCKPSITEADMKLTTTCLAELCGVPGPVSIFGDFNVPDIDWVCPHVPTKPISYHVYAFARDSSMEQLVRSPTRGRNILDLVFTSSSLCLPFCAVAPPFSTSDHNSIEFSILGKEAKPPVEFFWDFKNCNYQAIALELIGVDWLTFFGDLTDPCELWALLDSLLQDLIQRHTPRRARRGVQKSDLPLSLIKLARTKARLWRLRSRPGGMDRYNECSSTYKARVEAHWRKTEQDTLETGNLNSLFSYVRRKCRSRTGVAPLVDGSDTVVSDPIKAELLRQQYDSVFVRDDGMLPPIPAVVPNDTYLSHILITPDIVYETICKRPSKCCHSPDGIPGCFIRQLARELSLPLCFIFQQSLYMGLLPTVWLTADVIPIFKKGLASLAQNYRPIALTSCIFKIFETIVKSQLTSYLNHFRLISPFQHGFRSTYSTVTQLLECTNDWSLSLEAGIPIDVAYVDLSKAFDSVSLPKLLHKLAAFGVRNPLLAWFSAYLFNRQYRVRVGSSFSQYSPSVSGVPQGSVLGPLLFLIYVNDITVDAQSDVSIRLFADDSKLYKSISNSQSDYSVFQDALDTFHSWADLCRNSACLYRIE